MTILVGLVIATVLVLGWARGNIFVVIFLTLGCLLGAGIIGAFERNPEARLPAAVMIAVIWAPLAIRRQMRA